MGYTLACQVRMLEGLPHMDKAVLTQLALATSKDGNTVNIRLDNLAQYTSCAERTIRYALRRLEKAGYLIPGWEKGGRGHILKYDVIVAASPVVPPEHIPPPTNGHMEDTHRPHDPYKPEPLTPEQIAERKAKMEAARARIAEKPRPERKLHDRPGRLARERTGMVSGPDSLDGYSGGDETP